MFDFFREVIDEAHGIDSVKAAQARQEQKEKKRAERFIFSWGAKAIVISLCVLYAALAVCGISVFVRSGNLSSYAGTIIRLSAMLLLSLTTMIALFTKQKKGEVVALACALIFIFLQFGAAVM